VSSSFKFGQNFGAWKMALCALGVPFMVEATTKIRKILDSSVPHKPSKEDLRQYAIRRFPEAAQFLSRKKDDGRAEALIMALYARFADGK
jgi:crossover junction endodeoxyribonuclease RuvC